MELEFFHPADHSPKENCFSACSRVDDLDGLYAEFSKVGLPNYCGDDLTASERAASLINEGILSACPRRAIISPTVLDGLGDGDGFSWRCRAVNQRHRCARIRVRDFNRGPQLRRKRIDDAGA